MEIQKKKKIQHEKILVEKFEELSSKYNIIVKHTEINTSSTHMDCEFVYKNSEYIRAEAKVLPDTRNSSQKFLSIFGSILKGRTLPIAHKSNKLPVKYALIIDKAQLEKFKTYKKEVITKEDWLKFGDFYNVAYIFIVDKQNNTIKKSKWTSI